MKKLKDFIKSLFESPITPEEIDNIIRKAISDEWRKEFDVKGLVGVQGLECSSLECNCEAMYENVEYAWACGELAEWFCPAHGYKKR